MLSNATMMGQVVLITGGSGGIGRVIANRFLQAGADVVICSRHEVRTLPGGGRGKAISWVQADVCKPRDVEKVITFVSQHFERLDVLINNAGGAELADTASVSMASSQRTLTFNVLAPLLFSQQAHLLMKGQPEGGAIINIGCTSGIRPSPGAAVYGASKAALLHLTQTLAVEWGPKVRVNAVIPGPTRTEKTELYYGDEMEQRHIVNRIPLRRFTSPIDVAEACLFLASDKAANITGTLLNVDGGGEQIPFLRR
ncbi:MAG: SDR family oxidoreductase [Proteobacteria bacterium]|jgi:NAD(P)-dependent dehydrogenase (short-subunit alcohol dehydrogenase family)|nr:SDR family oxidoreductase [Pseudomonadota bacterium]